MYQSRRTQNRSQEAYRRPADQPRPEWMGAENEWMGSEAPLDGQPWQEEPVYDEPAYDEPAYEEPAWDERAYQPPAEERYRSAPQEEEVIATNRMVLLTCTLAAMMGLFAFFLCYAEKKSRAIRWFAVQSAGLTAVHLAAGAALLVIGAVLGAIPFLGFLITLICWIVYIAVAIVTVCMRVRMMLCAWQGIRFTLPLIGQHLAARFC